MSVAPVTIFTSFFLLPFIFGIVFEDELWVNYLREYGGRAIAGSVFALLLITFLLYHWIRGLFDGWIILPITVIILAISAFVLFTMGNVHIFVPDMILAVNNEHKVAEVESWRLIRVGYRTTAHRVVVYIDSNDSSSRMTLYINRAHARELGELICDTFPERVRPIRFYYLPNARYVLAFSILDGSDTIEEEPFCHLEPNYQQ